MKILFAIGTRPECIKVAPLIIAFRHFDWVNQCVVITSQHKELLQQTLKIFDIEPDYDLDIMIPNQSPAHVLSKVITDLQPLLSSFLPDWVIVQGDTSTALGVALGAAYNKIDIAHVEAGLRTYNYHAPFPEEFNRHIIDHISQLCFAPTEHARDALLREGILPSRIFVTGNTVVDALQQAQLKAPIIKTKISDNLQRLILVTIHRRENQHHEVLEQISHALLFLAKRSDIHIILLVHPNPIIKEWAYKNFAYHHNITLQEPLGYVQFIELMQRSYFIMTDSGGIQEEAPSLGKPVLVLRSVTERPEAVDAGNNLLAGLASHSIVQHANLLLDNDFLYQSRSKKVQVFGDGMASERIRDIIVEAYNEQE